MHAFCGRIAFYTRITYNWHTLIFKHIRTMISNRFYKYYVSLQPKWSSKLIWRKQLCIFPPELSLRLHQDYEHELLFSVRKVRTEEEGRHSGELIFHLSVWSSRRTFCLNKAADSKAVSGSRSAGRFLLKSFWHSAFQFWKLSSFLSFSKSDFLGRADQIPNTSRI